MHGILLALDKTVPFTLAQIAVPGLAPYAPALGRRRAGRRSTSWRSSSPASTSAAGSASAPGGSLHYVTFLAFVGATAHGVLAGTDSGTPWAWWMYVGSTVVVVFLFGYRVTTAIAARRGRRATRPPVSTRPPAEAIAA